MSVANKQCVMLIIDGLGDLPVPSLGNRTPLEAACTPNFDRLASLGSFGQVDPLRPGVIPNTDSGTGMLMGMLAAEADVLKRGSIEAAGAGRVLQEGEVALRANFASVEAVKGDLLVTDRRAGRIRHGLAELASELNGIDLGNGVCAELRTTEQHRGVLIFSGALLNSAISDTDPGDRALPTPLRWSRALRPEAEPSAKLLNTFIRASYELLQDHPVNRARVVAGKQPANILITRGAGSAVGMNNIIKRLGLSAALISGCNTVRGLGRMFDFELIDDPAFTAGLDTDLDGKVRAALGALTRHDMAYIQIKAPDICAHDRQPAAKRDFIERIDAAIAPLMNRDIVIAVATDHTTDSNTGYHTADPVPALLFHPGQNTDQGQVKFGELACRTGTMERQDSGAFLRRVLHAMGVSG